MTCNTACRCASAVHLRRRPCDERDPQGTWWHACSIGRRSAALTVGVQWRTFAHGRSYYCRLQMHETHRQIQQSGAARKPHSRHLPTKGYQSTSRHACAPHIQWGSGEGGTRDDGALDPDGAAVLHKLQEDVDVVEQLRHHHVCARLDLPRAPPPSPSPSGAHVTGPYITGGIRIGTAPQQDISRSSRHAGEGTRTLRSMDDAGARAAFALASCFIRNDLF